MTRNDYRHHSAWNDRNEAKMRWMTSEWWNETVAQTAKFSSHSTHFDVIRLILASSNSSVQWGWLINDPKMRSSSGPKLTTFPPDWSQYGKKTLCQCSKNLGKSFHWCCIKNAANVEIDNPGWQRIFIPLQMICCRVLPVSIGAHRGDSETFPKSQYQSIFTKPGRLGQRMDKCRLKFPKEGS